MTDNDHRFWSSLDSADLDQGQKARLIRDFFRPRKTISIGFVILGAVIACLPDLPDRTVATFAISADGCLLFYAYQDMERTLLANVLRA